MARSSANLIIIIIIIIMFIIIIVIMFIINIIITYYYRVKQRWNDNCIFIMHNAAFTHFGGLYKRSLQTKLILNLTDLIYTSLGIPVSSYLKYFERHFNAILG